MEPELYIYSYISDWGAEKFISALHSYMGQDVVVRQNTPGGNVFAAHGMAAKIKEHGNVTMKVDGTSMSAGNHLLLYAKNVEALDVSKFVLHRADMYVETVEEQKFLNSINDDIKKAMLARIDNDKLKELKGVSIEDLFDPGQRLDLVLNAAEAKEIKLIDKVVSHTPETMKKIAANADKYFRIAATVIPDPIIKNQNTMTLDELKSKHPELFNQVFALGKTEGTTTEKDRIEAVLVFQDLNPVIKEAVASGKPLTAKAQAELSLDALKKTTTENLAAAAASADKTKTGEDAADNKDGKKPEVTKFEVEARAKLGLK